MSKQICERRGYREKEKKKKVGRGGRSRLAETTIHQDVSRGGTTASEDN